MNRNSGQGRDVVVLSAVRTRSASTAAASPPCRRVIWPRPWSARRSAGRACPPDVGHAVFGNVIHTEARDMYLGRVAAVNGGLPASDPAFTLNRLCGSGLQAIVSAAQAILLGDCDVAVAGGAESMSRGSTGCPGMRWGQRMQDGAVVDAVVGALTDPFDACHMGVTAENVAADFDVSRADQDALAAESHRRAAAAAAAGYFTRPDRAGRGARPQGHRDRRRRRAHPARRDRRRPGQAASPPSPPTARSRPATRPASTTPRLPSCWRRGPTPTPRADARSGGSSATRTPEWSRGSWGSARFRRCARCSTGPASSSTTSTCSRSTRLSRRRRSRSSGSSGCRRTGPTRTAAASRSVTRSAPPAPSSPSRRCTSCAAPAAGTRWSPCASAAGRASPRSSSGLS